MTIAEERDHVPALVLASASPRRRELLERVGFAVEVLVVDVDETALPGEGGLALARRLAEAKARAAAPARPGRFVLGADTVVMARGRALGKPRDEAEARSMLEHLSGHWHAVVTAVALVHPGGAVRVEHALTRVRFAVLTAAEIARYAAGDEPYDKAGGYALQGIAAWFVEEVRGSVTNVIGLPLELVRRLLDEAGAASPPLGFSAARGTSGSPPSPSGRRSGPGC